LEAPFGELLPPETREKVDYFREVLRNQFINNKPRDSAWDSFKKRYDEPPLNDWAVGAIFGSRYTSSDQQRFIEYLY
ncbi:hypothetical protein R0J87_25330, partial [Halomonas sp. SIMBA_159]